MDKIVIEKLKVYAYHGVFSEEKEKGQNFYVTAKLSLDLREAAVGDDLDKTVNYAEACKLIYNTVTADVFDTIEAVAESVAGAILREYEAVRTADITIYKPEAPIGMEVKNVCCNIIRSKHTAYLGIGSNLGDRERYLDMAVEQLGRDDSINVKKISTFINTEPYGPVEQPDFLNGVLEIETYLSPMELLLVCQDIEQEAGRERIIHWGPRTLDIDILLYDDEIINLPDLRIPHGEMHKRYFVIKPLAEIAPHVMHPILHKTAQDMKDEMHTARKENPDKFELEDYSEIEFLETEDKLVVYAGVPGAYAEEAANKFFGDDVEYRNVKKFDDVVNAVMYEDADYGIIPIENSSAGFVSGNYDIIRESGATIVAETVIDIRHCLLGLKKSMLSDIVKVFSHTQGLMQCKEYIDEMGFETESVSNTAKAAKKVRDAGNVHYAAIASARAADIYDLKILEKDINFSEDNSTKFVIISKDKLIPSENINISICFKTQHKVGALYDVLGIINDNMLNMTSIESRPSLVRKWEYWFYVTIEGKLTDRNVLKALGEIQANTDDMAILGTF